MVSITVTGATAIFEVEGADKLWALRSRLEIPLAHIRGVRADAEIARGWWHGLRMPGTEIPGIITAGTFYQAGERMFWDVHHPEQTIVIELAGEHYHELVIEVQDPAAAMELLNSRLDEATR
ncbi:MAG TPA: hypothetical protein VFW98_00505 [Gemmatimonadaceae bacterium]|nr:hypothetical protein [Gemmatimonadaceae bacterium]